MPGYNKAMTADISFHVADYALFGVTLAASLGIGIFYAIKDRNKNTPKEYMLGGRHMPVIPTALSLLTSFLSGVSLLGIPVEIYKRGIIYYISRLIGAPVALLVAMFVALPILFDLRPVSVYEYFEHRFGSRALRRITAILYLLFMMGYMAVVLYAPAVSLAGIAKVKPWIFFVVVGIVCTFYTTIGGLKAVVWTDTLQAGFMVVGLVLLFAKGCHDNGGIVKTFEIAEDYRRYEDLKNWSLNPFQYNTMWTTIFGGIGFWFTLITFNQISVQRYLSLPTLKHARLCLLLNIPGYIIMCTLSDLLGIVMFTYFLGCDPIASKQVEKADQLVIYFAAKVLSKYPGVAGIFLACMFSGTLSTISSGINSMAAVAWEDFLQHKLNDVNDKNKSWLLKAMSLGFGLLAIVMSFAAGPLGGILKMVLSVMGAIGGPIVGLFLFGMLVPQANKYGAFAGTTVSVVITGWIAIGNAITKPYKDYALPLPTNQCLAWNISAPSGGFTQFHDNPYPNDVHGISYLYTLSTIFYPVLGVILLFLVGLPVSLITNCLIKSAKYRPGGDGLPGALASSPNISSVNALGEVHKGPRLTVQEIYGPCFGVSRPRRGVSPKRNSQGQNLTSFQLGSVEQYNTRV